MGVSCTVLIVCAFACLARAEPGAPVSTNTPVTPMKLKGKAAAERLLEWNQDTLVGEYERHGSKSAKWDAPARSALNAFAELRCATNNADTVRTRLVADCKAAVTNGCNDPLIGYVHMRFVLPNEPHTGAVHDESA